MALQALMMLLIPVLSFLGPHAEGATRDLPERTRPVTKREVVALRRNIRKWGPGTYRIKTSTQKHRHNWLKFLVAVEPPPLAERRSHRVRMHAHHALLTCGLMLMASLSAVACMDMNPVRSDAMAWNAYAAHQLQQAHGGAAYLVAAGSSSPA
jgi:hypothetical protein